MNSTARPRKSFVPHLGLSVLLTLTLASSVQWNVAAQTVTDCASLIAAINAIPEGGSGRIQLPVGNINCSQQIGILRRSVAIMGQGMRVSALTWTNPASAGIIFDTRPIVSQIGRAHV